MVEELSKHDFPMDQVLVLYKAGGMGVCWGLRIPMKNPALKSGAPVAHCGGSLCGLLDALAGAVVGAGIMAAGAALTHLTIALRRLDVPEDKLNLLH